MSELTPITAFADWLSSVPGAWSAHASARAEAAFIDTIAVMIPGMQEPVCQRLTDLMEKHGTGPVQLVGDARTLPVIAAALVGGTAAHALDFDDNFDPAKAHASAVLVPALLALGAERGLTTQALLDAYIVGLQITGKVGQGVNPYHRSRGWHATATVGAIGAAAACARLIGLPADKAAHALSVATSMAGGFMSQFGTMTKPLHAGLAAEAGVKAALFAEAGISAGLNTLDGPTGMRTLMVGPDVEALADGLKGSAEHGQNLRFETHDVGSPLHIDTYGLKVKRFPNCGSVHRALDGFLDLASTHGFAAEDIESVLVRAPAAHLRNLMYDSPQTDMEAKFSLEYNLAVAALYGDVGLGDFLPDRLNDPKVRAFMPRIRKDYVEKLESEFPTEVHVHLTSGATHSTTVTMPVGSTANPLSHSQLLAKAKSCMTRLMAPDEIDICMTAITTLRGAQTVSDLLEKTYSRATGD